MGIICCSTDSGKDLTAPTVSKDLTAPTEPLQVVSQRQQEESLRNGFSEAELSNIRRAISPDTQLDRPGLDRVLCFFTGTDTQVGAAALLFCAFDANGSGGIDADELIAGLWVLSNGTVDEKQDLLFRVFDVDRMGWISRHQTFAVIQVVHDHFGGREHQPDSECEHGESRISCKLCGAGTGIGSKPRGHIMMGAAVDRIFRNHDRVRQEDFKRLFKEFNQLLPASCIPTNELNLAIEPVMSI